MSIQNAQQAQIQSDPREIPKKMSARIEETHPDNTL